MARPVPTKRGAMRRGATPGLAAVARQSRQIGQRAFTPVSCPNPMSVKFQVSFTSICLWWARATLLVRAVACPTNGRLWAT